MNNLPREHQLGIEIFRLKDEKLSSPERYFDCIDLLRPLFSSSNFQNLTPGFYINIRTTPDRKDSLRLTYHSIDAPKTYKAIENFVKKEKDIKILKFDKTEEFEGTVRPEKKELFKCDNEGLRFRKFLNAYTQIGLDLLQNFGRLCTRRLVAKYRLDCHPHAPEWTIRPKQFFEPVFNKHSQFFRELNGNYSADQLWEDLERADGKGIWLHFLVNMLLPGDWNEYGYVIPEELKKRILEHGHLDMPENWEADCDF